MGGGPSPPAPRPPRALRLRALPRVRGHAALSQPLLPWNQDGKPGSRPSSQARPKQSLRPRARRGPSGVGGRAGTHQGRQTPRPGPGLSAQRRGAGCGPGTLEDGPGRPPGKRHLGGGGREPPMAGAGAHRAGPQGPSGAGASGLGPALSMVLPPARSCACGQRRPPPPSSPRRRSWLTPGRQLRKPDGNSAALGTGQSPGGRGAGRRHVKGREE